MIADIVLKKERKRKNIERLSNQLFQDRELEKSFAKVAEEQNKDISWAVANSYIQDIDVLMRLTNSCRCLNSQNLIPLILPNQIDGYYLISQEDYSYFSKPDLLKEVRDYVLRTKGETLPELPRHLNPNEVIEFLETAFEAQQLSWHEIINYRKYRKDIKNWLQTIPTSKRLKVNGFTDKYIINQAMIDGKEVYAEVIKLLEEVFNNKDSEEEKKINVLEAFFGCEIKKDLCININYFKTQVSSDIAKLILNTRPPLYNKAFFMDIPFVKKPEDTKNKFVIEQTNNVNYINIKDSTIVKNSVINESFNK